MLIKHTFLNRTVIPTTLVFLAWIVFHQIHFTDWEIDNDSLRLAFGNITAILLFISIGFGTSFIYPRSYKGGAGLAERMLASFFTPAAWTLKEAYRVSEYFTIPEVLYYILNTLFLLLYIFYLGQCGLWEMVCRRSRKKRTGGIVKIVTPLPVLSIVLVLAGVYVLFLWGFGVHFAYIYIDGYRALFH